MACFLLRLPLPRPSLALVESQDEAAAQGLADAELVMRANASLAYTLAPVPSLILRQP